MSEIAAALDEIKQGFVSRNSMRLRELGGEFISTAVTENDSVFAELSVMSYSLHKMLTKQHIVKSHNWPSISKSVLESIEESIKLAKTGNDKSIVAGVKKVVMRLEKIDRKLGNYVQSIYEKARVKQASSAYALGLSLKQAANLTGAQIKDVQMYVGNTKIHDEETPGESISQRLEKLKQELGD